MFGWLIRLIGVILGISVLFVVLHTVWGLTVPHHDIILYTDKDICFDKDNMTANATNDTNMAGCDNYLTVKVGHLVYAAYICLFLYLLYSAYHIMESIRKSMKYKVMRMQREYGR